MGQNRILLNSFHLLLSIFLRRFVLIYVRGKKRLPEMPEYNRLKKDEEMN